LTTLASLRRVFEGFTFVRQASRACATISPSCAASWANGSTAAGFCRMVPYDGTPIKDELAKAGRLRGDVCNPYYDFLDPKLGAFCYALGEILNRTGWLHGLESVSQTLNVAWSELAVMERLFPSLPGIGRYRATLQNITRISNTLLFQVVDEMADA